MCRIFFLSRAILELLVTVVLLALAWQLPGPADVADKLGRVERVGQHTSSQVNQLRRQLQALRQRQPEVQALAQRLQWQLQLVSDQLGSQQVDYKVVEALRDALGDVADGLDGIATTLDPNSIGQLGVGLRTTADYLEEKVVPAAARAAEQVEQSTGALREDAVRLSKLLRSAPLDLKAARGMHESLSKFDQGLNRLHENLKPEQLEALREGFAGLETLLTRGAEQAEKLTGFHYPVVSFKGVKPVVEQKLFWPDGEQVAAELRKAARGSGTAVQQLEALTDDLPALQMALRESRTVVAQTREALGLALAQQEKVEPLLKDVPAHAAWLAEELPRLGQGLARVLRDTGVLREVAGMLRQAQKGIDRVVDGWPDLRRQLVRSAVVLRATQQQLRHGLEHREEYEAALKQTVVLAQDFSAALPLFTEQLGHDLHEQETSLRGLEATLEDVTAVLPGLTRKANCLVQTTRLVLALLAALFGLHGGGLFFSRRSRAVERPA